MGGLHSITSPVELDPELASEDPPLELEVLVSMALGSVVPILVVGKGEALVTEPPSDSCVSGVVVVLGFSGTLGPSGGTSGKQDVMRARKTRRRIASLRSPHRLFVDRGHPSLGCTTI